MIPSKIERDQAGFAREVAQLNKQNDPHAIPTIDPGSQESATKNYAFTVPSALRGSEHGNGFITPTRRWRDNGLDCYYGRYEFTYPDGSMEDGEIVWPFCYYPGADPFTQPPHRIPFPFPLAGFKLPRRHATAAAGEIGLRSSGSPIPACHRRKSGVSARPLRTN